MKTELKLRVSGALMAMVGVLAIAGSAAAGPPDYEFQTIDHPEAGPAGTSVYGINSPGVMVGNFEDSEDGLIKGFVLREGQFTNVFIDDSPWVDLYKVNSQGTAVGDFVDDLGYWHTFLYRADGTIDPLPDFAPGSNTFPGGINNQNTIVGNLTTDDFATLPAFIYADGEYLFFDVPGADLTIPWDITDTGTVGGYFLDSNGIWHGFLRDRRGKLTQIDVPGATETRIFGLNNRGDLVGGYVDATGRHGFVFRNGEFITLDYPGATDTRALDVNNQGIVVGTYDGYSRGFVAYPSR